MDSDTRDRVAALELLNRSFLNMDIDQVRFSYQVELLTHDAGRGGLLVVEGPFRIAGSVGEVSIDPADSGTFVSVLPILRQRITSVGIEPDSTLLLTATGGFRLVVPPGEFEAWSMVGWDKSRVICMPGGSLAIWGPEPPQVEGAT